MSEVNKKLINDLFKSLESSEITPRECKEKIFKEIERIEDEYDSKIGNMEDLWQSRE